MKKILVILAAISISCFSATTVAQQNRTKQPIAQPIGTHSAQPQKKPNLFERLFGKKPQPKTIDEVIAKNKTQRVTPTKKPAPKTKKPGFLQQLLGKRKTPPAPVHQPNFKPIPVVVRPKRAPQTAPQPKQRPVITGSILCAGKVVTITPKNDTYILTVPLSKKRKRTYVMRRVHSDIGAVKLQNNRGNAYWLQLGNKSMLLDSSGGGRLADNCRNAEQQRVQEQLNRQPGKLF